MKKDADLSAAEVAPISGTGGTWGGIGVSSTTPEFEDLKFGSRSATLGINQGCKRERIHFGGSIGRWKEMDSPIPSNE